MPWLLLQQWLQRRAARRARADRAFAGRYGERLARRLLKKKGARILLKNWRHGHGELDIVCLSRGTLVFVEVRTRREEALVRGFDSLSQEKRAVLRRTIAAYLQSMRIRPERWRFDVVEVCLHEETLSLQHFEKVKL